MNKCKFCGRECSTEFCSPYHKGRYTLIHKFDKPFEAPVEERPRRRSNMASTLHRMRYGQ